MTTEVNDRPAERGINITNLLLTVLIILGGIASTMINFSLENVNNSVVAVETSVNNLNVDAGKMSVKIDNLDKEMGAVKGRIRTLEGRHSK